MDFSLEEEQLELQGLAKQILTDLGTHERLREIEASPERFDVKLWEELAKANLLGVAIPEEHGGLGFGLVELGLLFEEIGRAVPQIPAVPTLTAALAVARFGDDAQKQALLSGVASGDTVVAVGLQEHTNYEPRRPATTAKRDGDGWVIDGVKATVAYADAAARLLVSASTDDGGTGLFLVDPAAQGVESHRVEVTNRQPVSTVTLDGVRVGGDSLVGGTDADTVAWLVDHTTGLLCVMDLGVAESAMEIAAGYTKEREQFDVPIGSFQAVHQRLAECYISVQSTRLTAWQALWRMAAGLSYEDELAMAKVVASQECFSVCFAAIHLHGGMGVDVDYPVHRNYLWAKTIEIALGSGALQISRFGERLAGSPAA